MAGARRRPAGSRRARPLDARSLGEALSYPGIDGRTWVSYATVDADPVEHDDELGYLVPVTLQPSQVQNYAVVGQSVAGDGEGEHVPFVEGDTCLVAVPHGMERAGLVIIARLSNQRAKPPKIAAGQNATKNNLSYRKSRAPRVEEYGDRWTVRSATSEALIGFEANGTITLRDGGKGALQLSSDAMAYQSGDGTCTLQFDLVAGRMTLAAGEATLILSSVAAGTSPPILSNSILSVPAALQVASSGNLAAEHVATTEAVVHVLALLLPALAGFAATTLSAVVTPTPGDPLGPILTGPLVAALAIPATLSALLSAVVASAATTPQDPATASAIVAAFLAQPPKVTPVVPAAGQLTPGLGCAGTLVG
jgi:hypothetical protein